MKEKNLPIWIIIIALAEIIAVLLVSVIIGFILSFISEKYLNVPSDYRIASLITFMVVSSILLGYIRKVTYLDKLYSWIKNYQK